MGRMHSKGKGNSKSSLPYKRTAPGWLKASPQDVVDQICKLAKKGLVPSQIGVTLRDTQGIAQVHAVTSNKILRILRTNGLAPELPEDLYFMMKKARSMRKHLERNRKDNDSKFRLILIESRIHRLARYYKRVKYLPPNWNQVARKDQKLAACGLGGNCAPGRHQTGKDQDPKAKPSTSTTSVSKFRNKLFFAPSRSRSVIAWLVAELHYAGTLLSGSSGSERPRKSRFRRQ
ncbi:40S ribosomal protein S13 [Porphyridium purpureum]|uniref:40S ribosomal protein S13 n=1 Tax=Porphyridium purpureum TaxID=35688 RepID=A0A5J4YVR2_PORPP|nr:40S ribosomal protein S13 [Porphyridium purpureum]|eukprot:POR9451..scf209_3